MAPAQFKSIRERAGLTQAGLASLLRLSDSRVIRHYEAGTRAVSGPTSILLELLDDGTWEPKRVRADKPLNSPLAHKGNTG